MRKYFCRVTDEDYLGVSGKLDSDGDLGFEVVTTVPSVRTTVYLNVQQIADLYKQLSVVLGVDRPLGGLLWEDTDEDVGE